MNNFLLLFLSLSISGSLLATTLFALKPLFKNRLRRSWQYYIWLVVLLRLLFPFAPETNIIGSFWSIANNPSTFNSDLVLPEEPNNENEDISEIPAISNNLPVTPSPKVADANETPILTNKSVGITSVDRLAKIVPYIWIIFPLITLILITRKVVQYSCYVKFLLTGRRELDEQAVFEIYDEIRFEVNVKRYVPIFVNENINTPMLVGIIKPCIIMPETLFSDEEYRMIFRHELIHYKHRDIFYKWFTELVVCIHWFNPIVYFVRREINKNCELACDETVLSLLGANENRSYGDALMASLRNGNSLNNVAVSITMSEDGKNLKERLEFIMIFSNKSKLTHVLAYVLTSAIITGAFFLGACNDSIANAVVANDSKIAEIENKDIRRVDSVSVTIPQNESVTEKPLSNNPSPTISNDPDLEELYKLVYDEIKVTERAFDNISSVNIAIKNDRVILTKGGNKLFIRYGEWIKDEYELLEVTEGELTLTQNLVPQYTIRNVNTLMSSDNWFNENTLISSSDWLDEYLSSKGKQCKKTVEIIIPESININITIEAWSGDVTADGLKIIGDFSADTMSGSVNVKNSDINGKLKINTMSGESKAANCTVVDDLSVSSMSGCSYVEKCVVVNDLSVSSMSGDSYVENCAFVSLNMRTISGSSKLILPDSAKNYDISYSTINGEMIYDDSLVDKDSLRNSNAATRIEISDTSGRVSICDVKL